MAPRTKWLLNLISMFLTILGIAGIPADVRTLSSWLERLDSNTARWIFLCAGVAALIYLNGLHKRYATLRAGLLSFRRRVGALLRGSTGPQITIECEVAGVGAETPFVLRNHSEETAFNVQIDPIGGWIHRAVFPVVPQVRKGEPVLILCCLEKLGHPLHAYKGKFGLWLEDKCKSVSSLEDHVLKTSMYAGYADIRGDRFETECELLYNCVTKEAKTIFKKWGPEGTVNRPSLGFRAK